ncbi:hypothetical protein G5B10_14425 [Fluviicola sp. SGL-29]|nr:hypothetical protein [Fluviicola sp. SGL-29]
MKKICFLLVLFLISRNGNGFALTPPDSLLTNTRVETDIDLDENKIKEILFFKDTVMICKQTFIDGGLYEISVYDIIGRPLEITFLYRNGRVMETQEYAEGLMTRKVFYKKNRKIDVIFLYENGIQVDFIRYGSDGQPLRKKNK